MQFILDFLATCTGLIQFGTVVFLLFGPVRKYAFVLGFCSAQLITTLLEIFVVRKFGTTGWQYRTVFWIDEVVLDLLLFLILILLTYRAMEASPARAAMGKMLGAVVVIVLILPFALFKGAFVTFAWYDHTGQVLNFGAALLNLGLWTALLGARRKDPKILTLSAGFGILATGSAISYGLRQLSHGVAYYAANDVFVLSQIACASILCWAFRPSFGKRTPTPRVESLSTGALTP